MLLLDTSPDPTSNWEIAKTIVGWITSGAVPLVAAYLAYRYAMKNLRNDSVERVQRTRYDKIIEAGQAAWQILVFTTEKDNPLSIITFSRNPQTKQDTFYYHPANGAAFLDTYTALMYGNGHGLYLPQEFVASIAEYRGIIFGLNLKFRSKDASQPIALDNEDMVKKMRRLHQKMIQDLRVSMGIQTRELPAYNNLPEKSDF